MPVAAPLREATRSTLRLSEVARHLLFPANIATTGWADVEALCGEWGDTFDEWQRGAGSVILGRTADGMYAATVGGITLSIPRQVAKTFLVGRIIFALCVLFPGTKVLWTAHHTATLGNTFRSLSGFARRKAVAPYVAATRRGSGKEAIEFANGSVIYFGARSQGFGRGFDEVDVEVFDEAQILDEKALEDMVAATNQSRHPHGALLFYMGTPPRPSDPGAAFKARRRAALAALEARASGDNVDVDSVYIECSADKNANLDDRKQWGKANPSYPHRTPEQSMKRLRKNLATDDAWRREALGIWDDDAEARRAISPPVWTATGVPTPPASDGLKAFGVAFSQDGMRVALAGALKHDDGVHLELVGAHTGATGSGVAALADWLAQRSSTTATIVISGKAGSGVLAAALRERGVSAKAVHVATTDDYTTACPMLLDGLTEGKVTHLATEGQTVLDESVAVCDRKGRGTSGAWGWTATTPGGDETPTEAASLALWGAKTTKRRPGRTTRGAVLA